MDVKDYCSNVDMELTVWKAKIAQLEQEKYELESHISKLK